MSPGRSAGAFAATPILAAASCAGAAVIAVELAAVRLLAPWFGASQVVWTNVIGVVLLALAVGYLLGARLAMGARPEARLAVLLAASAPLVAWLPAAARALCDGWVPSELTLEQAARLLGWGSLGVSAALFLLPAILMGAAGPLAVEALQRRRGLHAGTAGGLVLCASTLASLAGAFATTYLGLPHLGLEGTFLAAAGLLAVATLVVAPGALRAAAPLALLGSATALLGGGLGEPRLAPGQRLLEYAQSTYQRVVAVESGEGEERLRLLLVNEGLDSYQSVWSPAPGWLPEGFYYNDFALPAHWAQVEGPLGDDWRVLALGLGAGTVWRVLEGSLPGSVRPVGAGVEIDPLVVDFGRRWFDLDEREGRLRVHAGLDARAALRVEPGPFDLIVLDAYANQVELPPHLVTVEFFAELVERLEPGGWLALNLGAFDGEDPLLGALGTTLATGFGQPVLALRVPLARNWTLFARREAAPPRPGEPGFLTGDPGVDRRLEQSALEGAWRWFEAGDGVPGAGVLSDRGPGVERLQRASLERGRRGVRG